MAEKAIHLNNHRDRIAPRTLLWLAVLFGIAFYLVDVLVDSRAYAGIHHVSWNGTDRYGSQVASGIYFCRLTAGRHALTQRIVLLK